MIDPLARLSKLLGNKLEALPAVDYRNDASASTYRAAIERMVSDLVTSEGAKIGGTANEASFRLAGIRATSTTGIVGAIQNWRTAAQRRIVNGGAA